MVGGSMVAALSAPANAAGTIQVSGEGAYDTTGSQCGTPPAGFADFTPLVLTGDLEGCLYTDILTSKFHEAPSGIYQETGRELVVASLNGGPVGTFTTTYRFESKWDPDAATGVEVKGRCQHPITAGLRDRRLRGCHRTARLQGPGRHRAVLLPGAHQARLTQSDSAATPPPVPSPRRTGKPRFTALEES
jgi:hypothetical protein